MSSNITVTGNLYADPVQRGEGDNVRVTFAVANEEGRGDNSKTVPVNVTAFGAVAKNILASSGIKKGKSVIIVGRLDGYKKTVVLDGEEKKLDMLSVVAFHVGPDTQWQTVEATKVSKSGNGGSGNSGSQGDGASSGGGSAKPAASDNADDF